MQRAAGFYYCEKLCMLRVEIPPGPLKPHPFGGAAFLPEADQMKILKKLFFKLTLRININYNELNDIDNQYHLKRD